MGQSISLTETTVDDGSGSIKVECPTYDDDDAGGGDALAGAATEESYPRKQEKDRRPRLSLDSNRNDDDDDDNNDTGGNETGTARNSNSRNNSSASESLSSSFSSSSQQKDYQQDQHHTTANRRNTSISSSIISICSNNKGENNNHHSSRNVTATAMGTSSSSERKKTKPKKERELPFFVTVSTPHQWKSAFAHVSDEEIHALLGFALYSTHHHHHDENEHDEHDATTRSSGTTKNQNQMLYETILATAYQIKRYRDFERCMVSDGEETSTWNTTTKNQKKKKKNRDRLTHEQHEYYNRGTHDSALIQLCVHILELTRPQHTSHRPGKNQQEEKRTTTVPVVDVSQVRLRLVPGRMKEHIFWEAFFVMLYTQWQAQHWTAVCREAGRVMQKTEDSSSSNPHTPSPNPNGGRRTSTTTTVQQRRERAVVSELVVRNNNLTEENQRLEHYVDKLWTSVQQLQLQPPHNVATPEQTTTTPAAAVTATIKTTIHEQQQLHKSDEPTNSLSSPRVNNEDQPVNQQKKQNKKQHTGTWIVSKDSLEFLALPAEAKLALRSEKQKRLKKVAEEMNFILDSDTLDATHGQWDCCHSTQYDGGDCEKCQSN